MKKSRLLSIALISILFLLSLSISMPNSLCYEIDDSGNVYNIVDGDTVDVSGVGRIRLADIDCPDVGEPGREEATNYISSLIYQKTVYVDIDDIYGTDTYGRIVAVLYVYYDATHVKNVNKAMLVSGHAVIWNFYNEFDPYSWDLIEPYPPGGTDPPPDPPPVDPPPEYIPPDNNFPQAMSVIGGVVLAVGVVGGGGYYAYKLLSPQKKRVPSKRIKSIPSTHQSPPFKIQNSRFTCICDVRNGEKNVCVCGKVTKINQTHEFTRKDGSKGSVGSFILSDDTKSIKIVVWDENTSFLNRQKFTKGKEVEVTNAYSKLNTFGGSSTLEVHLGRFSTLSIVQ